MGSYFCLVRADRSSVHIVPKVVQGDATARSKAHKWTNRIGNFAGIDTHANRHLSDKSIFEKYAYNKKSVRPGEDLSRPADIQTDPALDRMSYELIFNFTNMRQQVIEMPVERRFERFARRRGDQICKWSQNASAAR